MSFFLEPLKNIACCAFLLLATRKMLNRKSILYVLHDRRPSRTRVWTYARRVGELLAECSGSGHFVNF